MEASELARKWRRIEVGNTIAGLFVSVLAVVFLPIWAAVLLVVLMVLAVADTWYLGLRLKRTGRLFRVKKRRG